MSDIILVQAMDAGSVHVIGSKRKEKKGGDKIGRLEGGECGMVGSYASGGLYNGGRGNT